MQLDASISRSRLHLRDDVDVIGRTQHKAHQVEPSAADHHEGRVQRIMREDGSTVSPVGEEFTEVELAFEIDRMAAASDVDPRAWKHYF